MIKRLPLRATGSMMAAAALAFATAASAQDAPPAASSQGPLVVERIHNAIVVAPDYKVTEVNGEVAQLAGVYVGRVLDDTLLIGGAGYWLADGARGSDLKYGGVLIGWTTAPGRIRFGARGLVGGGSGTVPVALDSRLVGRLVDPRIAAAGVRTMTETAARFGVRVPPRLPGGAIPTFRLREDFVVFEPQVSALTKLTEHVAIDVAAGYRLIGLADNLRDELDGPTSSLAIQFGW